MDKWEEFKEEETVKDYPIRRAEVNKVERNPWQ